MEVQEAIGTRRTYRFLLPHKPVELVEAIPGGSLGGNR